MSNAAGSEPQGLPPLCKHFALREVRLYPWRGEYRDIYQDAVVGALSALRTHDPKKGKGQFGWMMLYVRGYLKAGRKKAVRAFRRSNRTHAEQKPEGFEDAILGRVYLDSLLSAAELDERERACLLLWSEGWTLEEIGGLMDRSGATACRLKQGALAKVRRVAC